MCSGSQIIGDASTSSTVIGSRYQARGLSRAHCRAATATWARSSLVVPYWCMCRMAASAYAPTGIGSPYGSSNCAVSSAGRGAFRLRLVRWVLP